MQGRRLNVSYLEKVLYPATGFTKRQVLDYYVRGAPFLVLHLERRTLTLKRDPNESDWAGAISDRSVARE